MGSALIGNKKQAKALCPKTLCTSFCLSQLLPLMWLVYYDGSMGLQNLKVLCSTPLLDAYLHIPT